MLNYNHSSLNRSAVYESVKQQALQDTELAFIRVCENGFLDLFDIIIRNPKLQVNYCNSMALKVAAEKGHHAIVERLLKDGRVDVSADNYFALKIAQQNNHKKVVDLLTGRGNSYPHISDPIMNAIEKGNESELKSLYYKLQPNQRTSEQKGKWIIRAAEVGNKNILTTIISIANEYGKFQEAMEAASKCGKEENVRYLMNFSGTSLRSNNFRAPMLAAANGHLGIVEYFGKIGMLWNENNGQAVVEAASNGHANVIQHFIKYQYVKMDAQNGAALKEAVKYGHEPVVKLLSECYTLRKHRDEALALALRFGNKTIINILTKMPKY